MVPEKMGQIPLVGIPVHQAGKMVHIHRLCQNLGKVIFYVIENLILRLRLFKSPRAHLGLNLYFLPQNRQRRRKQLLQKCSAPIRRLLAPCKEHKLVVVQCIGVVPEGTVNLVANSP